jgi:hypothetical protein
LQTSLDEYDHETIKHNDVPMLEQLVQRFHEESLSIPQKEEAQDDIAHAKYVYSTCASQIDHGKHEPIRIHVNSIFDQIQFGAKLGHKVMVRIVLVRFAFINDFVVISAQVFHANRFVLTCLQVEHGILQPNKEELEEVGNHVVVFRRIGVVRQK